ncbi:transcriptional regulator [Peptoniphilus asaccharolyticus DSM 20463]|uniref:Transcriptional regulator n=1 Tax=Peptoniphilus asaccharolyticus DSM 20463 TaxID=573058 RepID=A0A1W1UZL6_PEPAS|nr:MULTISPECIES: helix-turn-helix transcriptional regulator [Peptoniphilus]MBL7575393.1 helix-turn-helix transcriptional regulator [Peptoniphilus asaccharolyticus]SMB86450.1 transcriptional regulator [Peptoniphilus asaccharolyticus DSM 20463]
MKLYLKITKLMKEKNLIQARLLEKIDLDQPRLSAIMTGKEAKNISLRTALQICKGLDVDIYELIEGTEYDEENADV